MNRKQTFAGFLWLAIFALLSLVGDGRFAPLAAWLAPIFAIRFYRQYEKGGRGFLWLWLVTAVTSAIVWSGATALHFISPVAEPILATLMAPIALVPLVVDRFYYRRWGNNPKLRFWLTLVYPISLTAIDYFSILASPFGSFGAFGYSQMGVTTLMQVTAVTGLWGIPFIIGWFASLINYAWESDFRWVSIKRGVITYATFILIILGLSISRTTFAAPAEQSAAIGGFSLTKETFGATLGLAQSGEEAAFRTAATELNSQQIAQIRTMAQQGAEIVSLQEGSGMGYSAEIETLLADAAVVAQEEGIYIILPTITIDPAGEAPPENVVRIIDPIGAIVLEHYKYGGAQFEGSVVGSGELQTVETPYGTLSAIICWDADFQATLRQAGEKEIDLLFVPSNDWLEIKDRHAGMATFRSVENGVPIFRQTGAGISVVTDAYGRAVSNVDSFAESGNGLWSSEQIVATPLGSVNTLYSQLGDAFGQIMLLGMLGLLGFAWLKRKQSSEAAAHEQLPTPVHTH
mgnify:CR=1 FL=1